VNVVSVGFLAVMATLGQAKGSVTDHFSHSCWLKLGGNINKAIVAYKKAEGHLPDSLSSLVPDYLSAKDLRCPADRSMAGDPGHDGHADPAGGVSYSYETSNAVSGGMAIPPGPPPESDLPGKSWGSERNVRLWLRKFYGDRPPMVRCLHHTDLGFNPTAINLTLDGEVYIGGPEWQRDPETVAEFARRAARDLYANTVRFEENWKLSGISEITRGWGSAGRSEVATGPITDLATALLKQAELLKDPVDAERIAARLFLHVRNYQAAETAAKRLLARADHAEDEDTRQVLAESLNGRGLYREAGTVYQQMMIHNPESKNIRASLADTFEASGQVAEAEELRASIEPGRILLDHKAPEFLVPLLNGPDVSIAKLLKNKKAVLVNFWFIRCGPCREELPKLQKIYDEMKGKGLEVVAINSDDEFAAIRRYTETSGWTFPIALGTLEKQRKSIPELYFVELFPTNFLIDATGKVVYRRVGWDEASLREALKKLDVE
jgi:thiol-disulfide isomerase/thioredoxin